MLAVHLVGLIDIVRHWSAVEEAQAVLSTPVDDVSVMLKGPDRAAFAESAGRLARLLEDHTNVIGMDLGDSVCLSLGWCPG